MSYAICLSPIVVISYYCCVIFNTKEPNNKYYTSTIEFAIIGLNLNTNKPSAQMSLEYCKIRLEKLV